MGDAAAYWRYGGNARQQPPPAMPPVTGKRPRSDYDVGGQEFPSYLARGDERAALRVVRDADPIGASYDRYLRSTQMPPYVREEPARHVSAGASGPMIDDPRGFGYGVSESALAAKDRPLGMGVGRAEPPPLPHDASNTLFVEGLPTNCTRREASHIFRPFVGYKDVRLVTKEARHQGDPLILCFVDFVSPAHAATAMDALQGYKFDEHDRDSANLRLQFARYPGVRSGSGHRGKR